MARTMILGLAAVVAAAGLAAGKPPGLPIDPQVEGREPNPVARDFHEPEAVPAGFGAVSVAPATTGAEPGPNAGRLAALSRLGETILDRLTIPLGTVQMWD